MNRFTYEEIAIGHTERFKQTINLEKMGLFAAITDDRNPVHTEKHLCYGMLTASFLSTLAGMYIPGELSLIHGVEAEFPNPLVIDQEQTITVEGTVAEKVDTFKLLILKVAITNNDGKKVLRGKMKVGVRDG